MTDIAAARARLLEIVKAKAIVHGRVTLSSGKEADYYVDLRIGSPGQVIEQGSPS